MAGNENAAPGATEVPGTVALDAKPSACADAACPPRPAAAPRSSGRGAAALEIPGTTIVPGAHAGGIALFTRVGERQLGMRLLPGFYATVAVQPNRALDPVPPNLPPGDRVLVGLSYVVKF
jgi:hypothetical protein